MGVGHFPSGHTPGRFSLSFLKHADLPHSFSFVLIECCMVALLHDNVLMLELPIEYCDIGYVQK